MLWLAVLLTLLIHPPVGAPSSPLGPQTADAGALAVPNAATGFDATPNGMPFVHDPSTVIKDGGKYYVFTTGRGIPMLSSPDLQTWTRLGSVFSQLPDRVHAWVPKNNGTDAWAPDIIRVGPTFYLYYAVSSWGSYRSVVALATNTTLDPADPAYKWLDQGVVVDSDGSEEMNAIDPGVVRAPDGTMWLCYGSYHGSIKTLQLDAQTGLALAGTNAKTTAVTVARESEAADIIVHGGYFYLFVNRGSCCQGKKSEYNIRVGRSTSITGPYVDKHGMALTAGGGSLFLAAHDHRIGPGHFGRVIEDADAEPTKQTERTGQTGQTKQAGSSESMQRFSLHYEADLRNLGRPTLGIRPLLWSSDGWPIAGDSLAAGTYQIVSQATEDSLASSPVATTVVTTVALGRYLAVQEQQWLIEPAAGGFYKISNLGLHTALGVSSADDGTLELATNHGATDQQLWHLDQLTDGSFRICNKAANKCLTRTQDEKIDLTPFADDEAHRWIIPSP